MIAAVDGLAVGVGITMLLHCDLVYATPAASFRTPFLDLGLMQEAGSSCWARRVWATRAPSSCSCWARPGPPARAAEAGLVNAIVPAGELEAKALAAAKRLAAKPRAALLAARRMLKADPAADRQDDRRRGGRLPGPDAQPEAKEAFTAFLEKRPPDFAKARRGGIGALTGPAICTRDADCPAPSRAACRPRYARSRAACAGPARRRRSSPPAPATG